MKKIAALSFFGFYLLIVVGCFIDPSLDTKKAEDIKYMSYASLPWTEEFIPPQPPPALLPAISSINPSSTSAQGDSFTLTVYGANFFPDSVVQWNGTLKKTTYISSTQLNAEIAAQDITTLGTAQITVFNQDSEDSSNSLLFTISNIKTLVVDVSANDIIWDSVHQFLIASIPSTASVYSNSIVIIDPATGNIKYSIFTGNQPNRLAISGDCQFLYVGLDESGTIQRFIIGGNSTNPELTKDISISLGFSQHDNSVYYAIDIQVAPATPHTIAVSLGIAHRSPTSEGVIVIFDDANRRAALPEAGYGGYTFNSLQWGIDNSVLFAANSEDTGSDFYVISVTENSISLTKDIINALGDFINSLHYDRASNYIYSDSGQILNTSGTQIGCFQDYGYLDRGRMVPDSSLGIAYFFSFLDENNLQTYNINNFAPISSMHFADIEYYPRRLIRWGTDGLAFTGNKVPIYILSGPFVLGN